MKIISDLILKKIQPKTPPIWLMRQAGRYMREYNEIRSKYKNFMDFCYQYKETSEVTLQPIRKFNFDAAIIFSDILVVPDSLGVEVVFKEGYGPILSFDNKIKSLKSTSKNNDKFSCVSEAIKLTKLKLKEEGYDNKDLIGFSGSPFTLLTYILEKKRNNIFNDTRECIYRGEKFFDEMIDILTEQCINYLEIQVEAGVDILQLFESHAGALNKEMYYKYVINPNKKIVSHIKSKYNIPIIGFPKGSRNLYKDYVLETKVDAISIDYLFSIEEFYEYNINIPVQGNIDPVILLSDKEQIKKAVDKILEITKEKPLIFNLGHGILPTTPIENVKFLVDYIRDK